MSTSKLARLTEQALTEGIDDLQRQIRELRHDLAGEARTRRLVVIDDEGRERIEASVMEGDSASIEVRTADPTLDRGHIVILAANDSVIYGAAGVYVSALGNIVGSTVHGDENGAHDTHARHRARPSG